MASIIKVDNVQNQPGTNIVSKCGTDVTLGASGDTVALAAGASQTGFGRTGTVDWVTTPQTGTVTAATGKGYFVNTTSGEITVNLPAGAAGSIVGISDYASTANTNNILVEANGSEFINADDGPYTISTDGLAVTLVYVDGTRGWKSVTGSDADATGVTNAYIAATGGNQPTASGCIVCTNYKIHTFTGPGTFCVSAASGPVATADYFVVAGGGGGGGASSGHDSGGGGGGGGFRLSNTTCMAVPLTSPLVAPNSPSPAALAITATPYSITVGGGGAGGLAPTSTLGTDGVDSTFSTITSTGGGGGGGYGPPQPVNLPGGTGGSGGGASGGGPGTAVCGAAGNTPVQSPPQGQPGGPGSGAPFNYYGGGGGGAACAGVKGESPNTGGPGGSGSYVVSAGFAGCNGTPGPVPSTRYFAGGAGGGGTPSRPVTGGGSPGTGGGGSGHPITAGGCNTGGGGGGGDDTAGSNGGSGIVIIRYKFQ